MCPRSSANLFFTLNIGGLKSKTLFPDLEQFIGTYDVVCISKSKLGNSDQLMSTDSQHFIKIERNLNENLEVY